MRSLRTPSKTTSLRRPSALVRALAPLALGAALAPLVQEASALPAAGGPGAEGDGQDDSPYAFEYGMSLPPHAWNDRAIVFADAMTRASEFGLVNGNSVGNGNAPLIPLGQGLLGEGWPDFAALAPDETVGAKLFFNMDGTLPPSDGAPYLLEWAGTGSCRLMGRSFAGEANRGPQSVEVQVDPLTNNGIGELLLVIDESDALDPVRDVHVWLPGTEAERPLFWTPFIEKLGAMNAGRGPHTLRTMDWNRVNTYGIAQGALAFVFDLAGVVRPSSPSQGTKRGVCVEFQVALCNELGANLHLNVPHRTQHLGPVDYETFLVDLFTRVRDGSAAVPGINGGQPFEGLDDGLTVTLELSNVMWNPAFPVNPWMSAQAALGGITPRQQVAQEIAFVAGVARSVFAGPDEERLRVFVGGWNAQASFLTGVLDALPADFHVDAIGPQAYITPRPPVISGWLEGADPMMGTCPNCPTPEEVVEGALLSLTQLRTFVQNHRALAEGYVNPDGSSPVVELYEAGHSFKAGLQPWAGAALVAHTIPELYAAYVDELIPMFEDEGVALAIWYSFMSDQTPSAGITPFGTWDDMDQSITLPVPNVYVDEGAPKAAAIYRGPPIDDSCAPASATFRNAGTNPTSFTLAAPVVGGPFDATVDLTTTGHSLAALLATTDAGALLLPSGQTLLLADPGAQGELLGLDLRAGPVASWNLTVPATAALCGFAASLQAVHLGGVVPFALSNAQDVVFGG